MLYLYKTLKEEKSMKEFEAFMELLASGLHENPGLHNVLLETLLAFINEKRRQEPAAAGNLSYIDMLAQIEQQRVNAEKTGRRQLSEALKNLSVQLQYELQQSALVLHEYLGSDSLLIEEHLQHTGLDIEHFPAGFPPTVNLVEISDKYIHTSRELQTLRHGFSDRLPALISKLETEQQAIGREIRDLAWEALSTGLFTDKGLLGFHQGCLQLFQKQRVKAQNVLSPVFSQYDDAEPITTAQKTLLAWLQTFGSPFWNILNELLPKYKKTVLELLIRSQHYIGLEALLKLEPAEDEKVFFETLMTVRFGQEFLTSAHRWKTWLREKIDTLTHRSAAVTFWQEHPYTIPALVMEGPAFQGITLNISASLTQRIRNASAPIDIAELLEHRRETMSDEEVQIAAEEIQPEQAVASEKEEVCLTFEEDEESAEVAAASEQDIQVSLTPAIEREPAKNLWHDHVFPFITENWAPLSGGSMILTGLLLLEFYIWDKSAWLRYGLSPLILALVSFVLAVMGLRLRREETKSEAPIAIIQGFSVFLAPLSLLFAALFFVDSELALSRRVLLGLLLSGVLLAAWSYIFTVSVSLVYRAMARIHSATLLLLNALLLLLPVTQLRMMSTAEGLNPTAKGILIFGFYFGFLVLGWSMHRALNRMLEKGHLANRTPMIFYSVTCLGTFALVWGLTHARLMILPRPYTYGPLFLLFSFLILMVEFLFLEYRDRGLLASHNAGKGEIPPSPPLKKGGNGAPSAGRDAGAPRGRITGLSYAAYFFIGLGILLCLSHEYIRILAILMAGLIWLYQAMKFRAVRHFKIALILLTIGLSLIALIKGFPPPLFPFLVLGVALGIYTLALTFPFKEGAAFALGFSPLYIALGFAGSIVWQWTGREAPSSYGVAFALFGVFALYLGAQTDKLLHVHAGAGYFVAALPYLGMLDMQSYTLQGNTLVFGLAVVGTLWAIFTSVSRPPAMKDSRSTVLVGIGILALCLMCLRLLSGELIDASTDPWMQFQILNAPVVIAVLMFFVGYFTRSYSAVYLALGILVFILPEIKSRLNIPSFYGLGGVASSIGLLTLTLILRKWKWLRKEREDFDIVWRTKPFPVQAKDDYLLFAHPFVASALFLFIRAIFITYPLTWFQSKEPLPIYMTLAVMLAGTGIHFCSLWYRKSWSSYIGFIAIFFGVVHSCYTHTGPYFSPAFLPLFLIVACLYCEGIRLVASRILSGKHLSYIITPFKHLAAVALWIAAFGVYVVYSVYHLVYPSMPFHYWLPLLLYCCGVAFWRAWNAKHAGNSWFFILPGYLLLWQLVILATTRGEPLPDVIIDRGTPFHVVTALMVLGIAALFFVFEWVLPKGKYTRLTPFLWISLGMLLLYSPIIATRFYGGAYDPSGLLMMEIGIWAAVSIILGRYLSFGPLWLWGLFLGHLLCLPSITNIRRFYLNLHPLLFAGVAIGFAVLSVITRRFPWLYHIKISWSWSKSTPLSPALLFAITSQLAVLAVFFEAFLNAAYRHEWGTILGLFLAAVPALLVARRLGFSRHLLFTFPYALAWIGLIVACQENFPTGPWFIHLSSAQLIGCGIFGAVLTLVISDVFWSCQDKEYRNVKNLMTCSLLLLVGGAYLAIRDIDQLSWQWLLTSGILSVGAGVYFGYFEKFGSAH